MGIGRFVVALFERLRKRPTAGAGPSGESREAERPPVRPATPGRKAARSKPRPIVPPPPAAWDISQYQVPPADGKTRFHDLDIPPEIMHAIADLGFHYCTPVQAEILPKTLAEFDATGRAQTGTGKSAAFLITILAHLIRHPVQGKRKAGTPRALILAPTRELVLQIEKDARGLAKYTGAAVLAVYGGMDYRKQQQSLQREPVDIMAATPGRLLDFKRKGEVILGKVEVLVIDEADRMLDMGFIPDVRRIIESTPPKARRQTMLFSATLTPDVIRLASHWTKEAFTVEIAPEQVAVDTVEQMVYIVTAEEKFTVLYNLITRQDLERVIVFANRRDVSQRLADRCTDYGISNGLLSGDVSQEQRIKTLENFRSGKIRVLVATDVAARGLHIEGVSHVVNYNLPMNPEDYVHRIGRTGRAGASGISVSFADEMDAALIPEIEKFIGRELRSIYPDDSWFQPPVPVQGEGTAARGRPQRAPHRRGGSRRGGRSGPRHGRS
jgi:ATP-dependent RNA helicase RhlB